MLKFTEYAEGKEIERLVGKLGESLARHDLDPVKFVEGELPRELLREFWGFGKKQAPDTSVDFKGAMQSLLRVVSQLREKGMIRRVMAFPSGERVSVIGWLNDTVARLGKLNSKIYAPQTPYSQQPYDNQNPHGPDSYQTRYQIGAGVGINRPGANQNRNISAPGQF